MSKLTPEERKAMPKGAFGEPAKKAFPMLDAAHAKNAKSRAAQAANAGRISASEKNRIDAKADKVIKQAQDE